MANNPPYSYQLNCLKYVFNKKQLLLILLFFLSVLYLLHIITMEVNVFDEGIILSGADRVLKGHLPYNDFWTVYPPGQYYVLAFLFDNFGSSIFIERIYDITIKALIAIVIFAIIRKLLSSNKAAILGWILALFWIGAADYPAYPVYPAILLIYLAIYFFLIHIEKNNSSALISSSILLTVSAIFRHDFAAYAAVTILSLLLLRKATEKRTTWFAISSYLGGFLIVGLPFLYFILIKFNLTQLFNQLIIHPLEITNKYRWLPYPPPSLENIAFYIFPLISVIGVCFSLFRIIKNKKTDPLSYGILTISLLGVLFFNQARARSDIIHLFPTAINSIILVPIMWVILSQLFSPNHRWVIRLLFIIAFTFTFISPIKKKILSFKTDSFIITGNHDLERAGYAQLPVHLKEIIKYIQSNTSSEEAIYVGVNNHDKFIINDIIIYYLSCRNYATRYHEFSPGIANTLLGQKTIISELKNSSNKLIVLSPGYWYEPNDTKIDFNIDIVDSYIRKNYDLKSSFGDYDVWIRQNNHRIFKMP